MPIRLRKRGEIWHYSGTVAGRRLRGSTKTAQKSEAEKSRAVALRLAAGKAGVVAFSRTGDPSTGEFAEAVVIARHGTMPGELMEMAG